jgi:hypothetical protein
MLQGGFGNAEEQVRLAIHPFEVINEFLIYSALGIDANAMNNLNQQLHQAVSDFLAPLPTKGSD